MELQLYESFSRSSLTLGDDRKFTYLVVYIIIKNYKSSIDFYLVYKKLASKIR